MYSAILLSLLVPGVLSLLASFTPPDWVKETGFSWKRILLVGFVTGSIVGVAASAMLGSFDWRVLSLIPIGWILGVTVMTDYTSYQIPKRATQWAYIPAVVSAAGAIIWSNVSLTQSLISIGIVLVLPSVLIFSPGMGLGDIRLLFLTALALPWWIGPLGWAYSLLVACIVGIISFAIARIMNKGQDLEVRNGPIMRKIKHVEKSTKKVIPFGPALLFGFLVIPLFILLTKPEFLVSSVLDLPFNF